MMASNKPIQDKTPLFCHLLCSRTCPMHVNFGRCSAALIWTTTATVPAPAKLEFCMFSEGVCIGNT